MRAQAQAPGKSGLRGARLWGQVARPHMMRSEVSNPPPASQFRQQEGAASLMHTRPAQRGLTRFIGSRTPARRTAGDDHLPLHRALGVKNGEAASSPGLPPVPAGPRAVLMAGPRLHGSPAAHRQCPQVRVHPSEGRRPYIWPRGAGRAHEPGERAGLAAGAVASHREGWIPDTLRVLPVRITSRV